MSQSKNVTICIPTKNRCDFLKRAIAYYAKIGFQGHIFVADASDPQKFLENKENIKLYQNDVQIGHFSCAGKSILESVDCVNQFLQTPYASVCSDDDFLCLKGLEDAVGFMGEHPDYSACHGVGAIFGLDSSGAHGKICEILPYPQASIIKDTGTLRLEEYFRQGPLALVYSVCRSSLWKQMWRQYPDAKSCFIFDELIPSSFCAIAGKIGEVDSLYLVRQMHEGIYSQPAFLQWVMHPLWQGNFKELRERVVRQLIEVDHISHQRADQNFKEIFENYFIKLFKVFIEKEENTKSQGNTLKDVIKKSSPLMSKFYFLLKKYSSFYFRQEIGLKMLKADSKYFDDFDPIVKTITQTN
jgi:glycosyltransferase domain-containing protein